MESIIIHEANLSNDNDWANWLGWCSNELMDARNDFMDLQKYKKIMHFSSSISYQMDCLMNIKSSCTFL